MAKRSFVFGCLVGSATMAFVLLGVQVLTPRAVERAEIDRAGRTDLVALGEAEPAGARATLPARTATAPVDDGEQRCPMSGKTGRSTLSLEDVMNRVHGNTGAGCPYAARPPGEAQCPHLQNQDASEQKPGAIWL